VDQDSIEPVHDRVTVTLGHIWPDVQELWIAHILFEKSKKGKSVISQEGKESIYPLPSQPLVFNNLGNCVLARPGTSPQVKDTTQLRSRVFQLLI
jgi:hypothetical protein